MFSSAGFLHFFGCDFREWEEEDSAAAFWKSWTLNLQGDQTTAIVLIRKNAGRNQRAVYLRRCVVGHSLASSGSVPEIWVPGERD